MRLIKARVPHETKTALMAEATRRGEKEPVVIREALREYFARRQSQPEVQQAPATEGSAR